MTKLLNRCCYRHKDNVFLILEYTEGFIIRVIGDYKEYKLNSNESVDNFIQYYEEEKIC